MKRSLMVILVGVALLLSLVSAGGQRIQILYPDAAVCAEGIPENSGTVLSGIGGTENSSIFSFDTFYLRTCDVPTSLLFSVRAGNFFRTVKFMSAAHSLTDMDIPLTGMNGCEKYYNSNFTKTSYRYFVYTLRRLLI